MSAFFKEYDTETLLKLQQTLTEMSEALLDFCKKQNLIILGAYGTHLRCLSSSWIHCMGRRHGFLHAAQCIYTLDSPSIFLLKIQSFPHSQN